MTVSTRILIGLVAAVSCAAPSYATQGMICSGKGASIRMLFGHAAVPALVNAQLIAGDVIVPSAIARSWAGDRITWIDLADPDQIAVIASLRITYAKRTWRGTLTYRKRRIPVRCEEA